MNRTTKTTTTNELNFIIPNLDIEWESAKKFMVHPDPDKRIIWSKREWVFRANKAKIVKLSQIKRYLTTLEFPDFDSLDSEKKEKFFSSYEDKKMELPILVKLPMGKYELICGVETILGLHKNKIDSNVLVIDLPKKK